MTAAIFTQIENAVIATLLPLILPDKGGSTDIDRDGTNRPGYLRQLKAYAGEVDGLHNEEKRDDVKRALQTAGLPAILVTMGDETSRAIDTQRRRARKTAEIILVIASGTKRDRTARTQGDVTISATPVDPGVYQMMDDADSLLFASRLGMTIAPLAADKRTRMYHGADLLLYQATYVVQYDVVAPAKELGAGDIATIHNNLGLPASEQTIASGAGDSFAWAANVVTLTDAGATFSAGMVGLWIRIAGATTPENNGSFPITVFVDTHHVKWSNPLGVAEAFAGTWTITPAPQVVFDNAAP